MRRLLILLLLLASSCSLIQKQEVRVAWPSRVEYLRGMGEIDMNWKGTSYSGSASVVMDYPRSLILEVYGAFGQTLFFLKKEEGRFLFVGETKIEDETLFEAKYGLKVSQFMDDFALVGERQTKAQGMVIGRDDYEVLYGEDPQGRPRICWEGKDGKICLAFDELSFLREEQGRAGSGGGR